MNTIRIIKILAIISIFITTLQYIADLSKRDEKNLVFYDVDQGDMIGLIDGFSTGLIDTGRSTHGIHKLAKTKPRLNKNIEFIIITHSDLDHAEGIIRLSKTYNIKRVLINRSSFVKSKTFLQYLSSESSLNNTEIYDISAGDVLEFGIFTIQVIWPNQICNYSSNDCSISTIITNKFNKDSFLLFGDLSSNFEELLLEKYFDNLPDVNRVILKLSHHGSAFSSSFKFLHILNPKIAIISVGSNNPYGHPATRVLNDLNTLNISYLSTAEEGDIVFKIKKD